jgi:hypothetical protein
MISVSEQNYKLIFTFPFLNGKILYFSRTFTLCSIELTDVKESDTREAK